MALPLSRRAALFALGSTVLLGSCTIASDGKNTPNSASASEGALKTVTPGKLTIATGEPAYSPWVENNDPASGKGFEAAVAYAVAGKLGFANADVVWVRSTFDAAVAPGAKDWDFNLQQFSITEERRNAVDFSSPYYTTAQAVVTLKGSPVSGATTVAELKGALLGAQTGTTSHRMLTETVAPTTAPSVFNNSQDTVQALKGGQVDAIVVDLPTALYLVASELDDGVVVGQFADTSGGDQFGLVLPKGSALTAAVTGAVDALRADGTLDSLTKTWLSETVNVPVLS
ncbi:amino acid ABC transporter substrate-binding protein [Arachnia propionica]|uniref:Amino acid ABC transporter substrate-binding protein n=1 Tax=Arachnia propionica TaxID=1750 RepID=A0AB37I049_9ACTN|nr:ABC transporter substrate-binding protein [Arachnia propionica]AFN46310.1 ABC transporter, substrate-binding protein, family 3 [Arachnia propionica F0230a]QCT37042.1 amino acid ABC transporter substrate-binding protein [Arachnia propionica]QUC10616.1 amino acid ABC transporter substrate-binding protein [Arachnia propionica]RPA17507.1 amino acid ABC transporter substrate-binding protein [Arachnia propionica]